MIFLFWMKRLNRTAGHLLQYPIALLLFQVKGKMHNDMITVVNEDNIWKVKLPEFVSDLR